jgi:serine/threonine-protein kinase
MVARESEITITVSLGPAVIVPNFNYMTMEEAREFPDLRVIIRNRYHAYISFGQLLYQSEEPGTELIGEDAEIVVYFSLGRPFIENIIGRSQNTIPELFYNFVSQGANISYTVIEIDSHLPRGQITDASRFNQWLSMDDHVYIWVSRGNLPPPGDNDNNDDDE